MAATGALATATVTTQPECTWSASAEAGWITELAPAAGQGSGDVRFRVMPNPDGRTRQGAVAVNDQRLQVRQDAAPCRFELVISRQHFDANGAAGTVTVTAPEGCSWSASSSASWLTITSSTGGSGSASVAFRVARNGGATRNGTIAIGGEVVAVSQENAPEEEEEEETACTSSIQPNAASMAAAGGSRTIAVTSTPGCAWTATSSVPWITITAGAVGSGDGAVTIGVAANNGSARTARMQIAGETFTLSQSGLEACSAVVSPASQSIAATGATGATVAVSVGAGCAWTAASNDAWITMTSGPGGTGNGTVAFNVASNNGGARTGTLAIAGHTFTVSQAGTCTYSVSPTSASIGSSGGTGMVTVSASTGCMWTATGSAGWITITSGANGTGTGSVAFSVAANSGNARTGTLTVAGQSFTVNQSGACTYTISPTSATMASSGGAGTVAVSTSGGCGWTATANAGWITITSGTSGSGNGTVAFTVAELSGNTRTGSLTIAGHTFTVTQIRCSYALSRSDQSASALGGTFTVSVSTTAGCAWSATSSAPWVSVTSGANGTGNGSVTLLVLPNLGGARTGTLTIAGQTFTVKQASLLSSQWQTSPDPISTQAEWRLAHRDPRDRLWSNRLASFE